MEDKWQLAFEELSDALVEVEMKKEHLTANAGDKTAAMTAPKRNIGYLPDGWPCIQELIEPNVLICLCGCGIMREIGEYCSERLDIVPTHLRSIVAIRRQ